MSAFGVPDNLIQFLTELRLREREIAGGCSVPAGLPSPESARLALASGQPILAGGIEIDPAEFAQALETVTRVLTKYRPGLGLAFGQPAEAQELAAPAGRGDSKALAAWAQSKGLPPGPVTFLAQVAARPFWAAAAREAATGAGVDPSVWTAGSCPVCGSNADLARLDEKSQRWLHCPTCDFQWVHSRVACAFCGQDSSERLGYFNAEGEDRARVDFCRDCGCYLKTYVGVPAGTVGPSPGEGMAGGFDPIFDPILEDARTIVLDLVAKREGFRKYGEVPFGAS